jgi:hypothetical protein
LSAEKERLTSEWETLLTVRQASLEFEQLKTLEMTKNFADKLEREIEKLKLREEEMCKVEEKVASALFCITNFNPSLFSTKKAPRIWKKGCRSKQLT